MERQDFIYRLLLDLSPVEMVQVHNEVIALTGDVNDEFYEMKDFNSVTSRIDRYDIFYMGAADFVNPEHDFFRFDKDGHIETFNDPDFLIGFSRASMAETIDGFENRYLVYLLPYIGEQISEFDDNECPLNKFGTELAINKDR